MNGNCPKRKLPIKLRTKIVLGENCLMDCVEIILGGKYLMNFGQKLS